MRIANMETWSLSVCIFIWYCIPRISTELIISPTLAMHAIGDTVRLNCSDADISTLYWIHQPAGTSIENEISYPGRGILTKYKLGGRHRVELESGSCNLVITNISTIDAGTYACCTPNAEQITSQLIVIDSGPRCISNTSLADLVCNNDCNLDPDRFELDCSVVYHGNIPPVVEWRHSGSSKSIQFKTSIEAQSPSNHTITIKSSTLSPSLGLNGTHYVCSLENMRTERINTECVTENIQVTYFFKSSISRTISSSSPDRGRISCQANTSEHCDYRWEGTAVSTGRPVEYVGQTIDLTDQEFRDMRCLAECRIRERTCFAAPLMLTFEAENKGSQDYPCDRGLVAGIVVVVILLVVSDIIIVLVVWKRKPFTAKYRRKISIETNNHNCDNEMEPMNCAGDDDDDIVSVEDQFTSPRYQERWINKCRCKKIDSELIARFERVTGRPAHHLLKRGLVFSHRDLELILDRHEKKQPFYLYTGRGPTSEALHLGSLVPFTITKWLQDTFDVPLVIQITDDEKFMVCQSPFEDIQEIAIKNVEDIIAFDFNPEKTFIFIDTDYIGSTPEFYRNMCRIQNEVTFQQIRDIFEYKINDKIGKIGFPVIQAAPSFSSSFPQIFGERNDIPSLIPCAIDQDPFFRMTRDVAKKLGYLEPAIIYTTHLPALQGAHYRMSSRYPQSAIQLTDTPENIEFKIKKHALEGDCEFDVSYQYLRFFLEDDKRLEEIREEYTNGTLTSIDMKKELISVLQKIVADHQERRKNITDEIVKQFMKPRKLGNEFDDRFFSLPAKIGW